MKIETMFFDELSKKHPNNYLALHEPWNDTDFIVIDWENGELVQVEPAKGEPEDVLFCRDLSWVKDALIKAYELGKKEARREVGRERH